MNAPIVPIANFQRDGPMAFVNQGNRPNYQSSIQPLTYAGRKGHIDASVLDLERDAKHENFIYGAWRDLSEITERKYQAIPILFIYCELIAFSPVDFEQPRALWLKVWGDKEREAYIKNVAGHFGQVKSPEVKARQCKFLRIHFIIQILMASNFFSVHLGCC